MRANLRILGEVEYSGTTEADDTVEQVFDTEEELRELVEEAKNDALQKVGFENPSYPYPEYVGAVVTNNKDQAICPCLNCNHDPYKHGSEFPRHDGDDKGCWCACHSEYGGGERPAEYSETIPHDEDDES